MEKDKKKKEANRKYKKTSITEDLESGNSKLHLVHLSNADDIDVDAFCSRSLH